MKKLLPLLLCTFSLFIYGQEEKTNIEYHKNSETKVTSLIYSTSSVKELEAINWEDVKNIFESNKEEEIIKMGFEIDLPASIDKFKGSMAISGKAKDIDSLIIRTKKILKGLIKISKTRKS